MMAATQTEHQSNLTTFDLEEVQHLKIHELNAQMDIIRTTQLILNTESQDVETDIELELKNEMMEMITMEMDDHLHVLLSTTMFVLKVVM